MNVVFVDRSIEELGDVDVVSIENFDSARRSTEYMIGLGHTRIGLIYRARQHLNGSVQDQGYKSAHNNVSIQCRPPADPGCAVSAGTRAAMPSALFSRCADRRPALIVANTAQVQSSVRRLVQIGVRIPGRPLGDRLR